MKISKPIPNGTTKRYLKETYRIVLDGNNQYFAAEGTDIFFQYGWLMLEQGAAGTLLVGQKNAAKGDAPALNFTNFNDLASPGVPLEFTDPDPETDCGWRVQDIAVRSTDAGDVGKVAYLTIQRILG